MTFWVLMAYGWFWDELGPMGLGVLVSLWLAGRFGLPFIPSGEAMFASYMSILDIALVFMIFKGDVRF